MTISIDGKSFAVSLPDIFTIEELIAEIQRLPELDSRVIMLFNRWKPSRGLGRASLTVVGDAEIEIETRSTHELISETASTCREYLPNLVHGATTIAVHLQQSREREAATLISDFVEGVSWYSSFLAHVGTLVPIYETESTSLLTSLNEVLEHVLSSWEQGDYTLVADLLEYELCPELERGIGYLDMLLENLPAGRKH